MEVFRELYLRGEPSRLAATMDEIERRLPTGWTRDKATESKLSASDSNGGPNYYFLVAGVSALPTASLFITEGEGPRELHVSNVCPRDVGQLPIVEYNAILEEFYEKSARPAAEAIGVEVQLTDDEQDLRDWLSDAAAKKLRDFCRLANKGTGGAHPLDRKRWLDFVVTAHREKSHLDATTLRRWLVEDEGWYFDVADRLAGEYEFGGEVLTYSNASGVGA